MSTTPRTAAEPVIILPPRQEGEGNPIVRQPPPTAARRKVVRPASLAGTVLFVLGLVLALFAVFEFVVSGLLQARSQSVLLEAFRAASATAIEPSLTELLPEPGDALGIIEIPSLRVVQMVVEGISPELSKAGPAHLSGSPLPGQFGNVVVAGRRTTYGAPFRDLDRLRPGAEIRVTTTRGQFRYLVTETTVIRAGQRDVLTPTADARLTLITSDPRYLATNRLAVIAVLQGRPLQPSLTRNVINTDGSIGLSGDASAIPLVILWGQALVIVALATFWLYRRWSRHRPAAHLLTTPVLLALLVLLFQSMDRLLPATI